MEWELESRTLYLDDVEDGYWEKLDAQVAEGRKAIEEGRVYTKEEALQYVRNGLYEAILRHEKRVA